MFQALFNIIFNLLASIIQIVVWPINQLITSTMPNIADKLEYVGSSISTLFGNLGWALSIIPSSIVDAILFFLTIEVAKHTIFLSTHTLIKVWNLFQKLKFW